MHNPCRETDHKQNSHFQYQKKKKDGQFPGAKFESFLGHCQQRTYAVHVIDVGKVFIRSRETTFFTRTSQGRDMDSEMRKNILWGMLS